MDPEDMKEVGEILVDVVLGEMVGCGAIFGAEASYMAMAVSLEHAMNAFNKLCSPVRI